MNHGVNCRVSHHNPHVLEIFTHKIGGLPTYRVPVQIFQLPTSNHHALGEELALQHRVVLTAVASPVPLVASSIQSGWMDQCRFGGFEMEHCRNFGLVSLTPHWLLVLNHGGDDDKSGKTMVVIG